MKKIILLLACVILVCSNLFSNELENQTKRYEKSTISAGVGFGNSYGLFGLRGQYVTAGDFFRFGLHGGIGTIPDFTYVNLSLGSKLFFRDFYLGAQYSVLDYFTYTVEYGAGTVTSEPRPLYGPGVMVGFDTTFERLFNVLKRLFGEKQLFPEPTHPRPTIFYNNSLSHSAKNNSNKVQLGLNVGAGFGVPEIETETNKVLPLIDIGITLSF